MAAMRLRGLLRGSIDALSAAFGNLIRDRVPSLADVDGGQQKQGGKGQSEGEEHRMVLAALKRDYNTLLQEGEEALDSLADALPRAVSF